ncbi:ECF-type sigma factor [Fodinibius saliphilus]|uniref:ECF-type sigma factor n=1 Tax=Fodinibius saliphilus TaxID=1920650 RepID=UPI001109D14B|nr:ECF-type sigma factor [Fodinibius saliphilus]
MTIKKDDTKRSYFVNNIHVNTQKAYNKLFSLLYEELKKRAYLQLMPEKNKNGISNTDLVHELYLKMLKQKSLKCNNYNHFLSIASNCMHQILIDQARKQDTEIRGTNYQEITFHEELGSANECPKSYSLVSKSVEELSVYNKRLAKVVRMRFFHDMTMHNIAKSLKLSERTIKRDWNQAKNWLYNNLKSD